MRTEIETLIDKLLLLYSIEQGNKYGLMEGTFKLQKVPFASELSMNEQGTKGFNYTFFKYWYGPISKEIYEDGTTLHVGGLITTLEGPIKLTQRGREVFDMLGPLYKENQEITEFIDSAAKAYASLSFGALKQKIYDLSVRWAGDKWKVGKIPPCVDVLTKLDANEARKQFRVDDDWVDSLWGTLNYTEEQTKKLRIVHKVAS